EKNTTIIVGMDVHKETISSWGSGTPGKDRVESFKIQNTPKDIEKMVKKAAGSGEIQIVLKKEGAIHFVYEAGPCGYVIARQIKDLGYACSVIAPGLIPVRPTDRVKTDRRDAEKLARLFRADELTAIRIPEGAEEAARDLVRAREDALTDQTRDRNRLTQFLLR
ncbi:transposase IS116/IS110/IS902 family protein, partial [mine drainage metagenome]